MLAINIQEGLTDAWTSIATFVPKLVGFALILIIGYIVAKVLERIVDALLERVGFDRWVERGSFGQALARSKFDASDILAKLVFWTVFLIALQLAFGAFGPNPVSDLISVPANAKHWFDAGENPSFAVVRVFTDTSGWTPHYTGTDMAVRFPAATA